MTHDSQLCSSNDQGLTFYTERLAAYLASYPEIDVIGIIPNDGRGWCECSRCRALEESAPANVLLAPDSPDRGRMSASGRYHRIVSFVARRMNTHHPRELADRKISFWAYNSTIMPSEAVKSFPDNTVLSGFAPGLRCYAHGLDDARCGSRPFHLNSRYLQIARQWNETYTGPKIVYEYYRKYVWLTKPKIMPDRIGRDVDCLRRNGFDGLTSMCEMDAWPIYELNQNAFLDFCWNDRRMSGESYIPHFAARKMPRHVEALTAVLADVQRVMDPFGLLGGRYPHGEIKEAIRRIEGCRRLLEKEATTADGSDRDYLNAWRANLTYLGLALRSDLRILTLIEEGDTGPDALQGLVRLDRDLLGYVNAMDRSAFLHSERVADRLGRRIDEVEAMIAQKSPAPLARLRSLWEKRWF